ncbi:MAG: hypothetical protein H7176_10145, partial [Bdellovibrionales bacterium]|nr:hypothetical protein [Massilia sp.]
APTFASHCKGGETTYFNCSVKNGGKLVSLCGKDEEGEGSYLQYRYGTPRRPLELIYPPATNDAAMGTTFFFDSSAAKDGSQSEAGVWFEHENTYYKLKYGVNAGPGGQLTTTESEILMWAGVPSGAPRNLLCKQTHGGENLLRASALIKSMSPKGRVWQMSPLDVHYQPKPQAQAD